MGSTKVKKTKEETPEVSIKEVKEAVTQAQVSVKAKVSRNRSRTYMYRRSQVDKTKLYPVEQAVELIKKLSRPKHPTITADINYKDESFSGEIAFPHATGKVTRVAILDEALLEQIAKGVIEFDVLIAKPDMMGKIAKYAKILGPRGLMPNPKNKTVTPDPEKRKTELESGKTTVKSEKKSPLIHVQIGKKTMKDAELVANLYALVKQVNPAKIYKLTLSSTMSPGVKVDLNSFKFE